MATLTVQIISVAGISATYAAAGAVSDEFQNDGRTHLHVKNTGTQKTATITIPPTCSQGQVHSTAVVIPATTGDVKIGPFPPERYNNASGMCTVSWSSPTAVTVAAFKS